jgi:hemin uptake protein HemP
MRDGEEGKQPMTVCERVDGAVPAVSTAALFKGQREIVIEHNGELYRLRITRQGKLILNK